MPVIQVQDEFQSGDNVTASSLNDLVNDASFVSGAVDNSTLQVASAGHLKVKDNGILSNHLKSDATNDAVRAVTTNHIRDEAVTTAKIDDLAVTTGKIAADAVTYAKIQNVSATDRVLGRDSAGAGNVEEITPSALRTMINVEDGATADQTASEIKTAYESNNDTNVFTDAEKNKLTGIAVGAEVNVQSDWDATSGDAFIKNKPTIPTNNNQLTNGAGYTTNTGTVTSVATTGGLTGGTITGSGTLSIATGGVTNDKISSTDNTFKITTSEVVVNEGGADKDFRVEGSSEANLLVVDAGQNKVAVGGAYPSGANKTFYVNGDHTDGSIGCTGNIQINTNDNAGLRIFSINNTSPLQAADIFNDNQGTINFTRPQKTSNATTHLFAEDGDTTSITGSYGTISDKNFKENINYLTDEQKASQIDDIKNLRFAKFNIKGDDRTQLGVIAQDVEQTSPGLVSRTVIDGKEVLAVKQSIIHQKAVVALQVALQKIEDLEQRLKLLES